MKTEKVREQWTVVLYRVPDPKGGSFQGGGVLT